MANNLEEKTVDTVTTTYTYDEIDQLMYESRTGYSASYTYDNNGNRLTKTHGGNTYDFYYDSGDKLTEIKVGVIGLWDFDYDAAGRTTRKTFSGTTQTNFVYDFESRLTSVTKSGVTTNTFAYNGLDTRISKVDSTNTYTYKRMGAGVTAPVLDDGFATYTPGVSERRSSTTSYFMTDRLGTHKGQTNTSQSVVSTRAHDAFGNVLSTSGSSSSPFGFAGDWGYQHDADHGLKLLGHRYYDSSIGRFLTRDPAKDGRNWYAYCGNNPLKWVDPNGLDWHNPSRISVDPNFDGTVVAIGEPGEGQEQVMVVIGPGQSTVATMDVDLIIVQPRNGRPRIYFLPGIWRKDKKVPGPHYKIDGNGNVIDPVPWWELFGAPVTEAWLDMPWWPHTRWRDDIEKASGRRTPRGLVIPTRGML